MGGYAVVNWTLSFWRLEKDNPVEVFQLDEISSESLSLGSWYFFPTNAHSSILVCHIVIVNLLWLAQIMICMFGKIDFLIGNSYIPKEILCNVQPQVGVKMFDNTVLFARCQFIDFAVPTWESKFASDDR